ncbi:MAG: DUF952 domain-containing protein [Anaerolineales bacterium]|nr:DUF952 domain-containing protein [Anaerolineales bacterium]
MTVILHLLTAPAYAARAELPVVVECPPGSFLHLTAGADVLAQVANTFMLTTPGEFVVLEVSAERLGPALRWEPPDPPAAPGTAMYGKLFPHLYGPLLREAVVGVRPAVRAADGTFLST